MARLDKDDLAQMDKNYFQFLAKERLVEVAVNLHQLAVEQCERLELSSSNSSRPPSTDNPYQRKNKNREDEDVSSELNNQPEDSEGEEAPQLENQTSADLGKKPINDSCQKRKPGKQLGAKGFGRTKPLVVEEVIPHYPDYCASCNQKLTTKNDKPYMGYYVLELKPEKSGFKIVCQLHHYYELTCECGHKTKASPGSGYISTIDGRSIERSTDVFGRQE